MAKENDDFSLAIKQYVETSYLSNILDSVNLDVLQSLLNGYSFALDCGICLLYPDAEGEFSKTFTRIDAQGAMLEDVFQPLCACWRDDVGCGGEQSCENADESNATYYFTHPESELRLYRCQPLGLWDMTYPIRVDGNLLGVLFAGQAIVRGGVIKWKTALEKWQEAIDWTTTPDADDQILTVRNRINSVAVTNDVRSRILEVLDTGKPENRALVTLEGLLHRV